MLSRLLLPPPRPFTGALVVASPSPSALPSSSLKTSLAVVLVIFIVIATVTCTIILLRRTCRRRRLSSSSPSSESASWLVAATAGASPGPISASSSAVAATSSAPAETTVAASSAAAAAAAPFAAERPAPSAPPLPEVERVILALLDLSLASALVKLAKSTICTFCDTEFFPGDELLLLPACLHPFHQSCIITWLRATTPSSCPSCHAPVTLPFPDLPDLAYFLHTGCSDEDAIDAQMTAPAPPGEEVAEAVGSSRGWLGSYLRTLSDRWSGCSSSRAAAAVVPVSSLHSSGSWSGYLGDDLWSRRWDLEAAVPTPEKAAWLPVLQMAVPDVG